MRIAMIGSRGLNTSYGGIERVLDDLCPSLVKLGHKVDVFSRPDAEFMNSESLRSIPVTSIGGKHLETISRSSLALLQAMGRYDIVHLHALGPGILTLFTKALGQKAVVTIHGLDHQRAKWNGLARWSLRLAEQTIVKNAEAITVVSESLQQYLDGTYGVGSAYIPNGVNHRQAAPPGAMMAQFGLSSNRYVLFASRLTPEKGCHDLIAAFNSLDTDMKLVIAGGSGKPEYLAQLKAMANSERVCFVDHRTGPDLHELFSNAYLFALPSYIEGMSMALLEAISFGLPVAVSSIPENRAVLRDAAFYFPKQDIGALRATLARAIAEPRKVEELRSQIRRIRPPDWDSCAGMYQAIYDKVLQDNEEPYSTFSRVRIPHQ